MAPRSRSFTLLAVASLLLQPASSFVSSFASRSVASAQRRISLAAVSEVASESEFDGAIGSAGDALVIVDYSTTWCGPCKVMEPKFVALSDVHTDAVFLKVVGDSSPDASKLMKREGVRSVPSFHYWKNGEKVDMVNGANQEAVETTLRKHL